MDMRRTGPDEVVATFSYAEAVVLFAMRCSHRPTLRRSPTRAGRSAAQKGNRQSSARSLETGSDGRHWRP